MSHITIIIRRSASAHATEHAVDLQPSYEYQLPIAHGATAQQVGEAVRKAYKRLESNDD